jgi:P-type Cu+ transporter
VRAPSGKIAPRRAGSSLGRREPDYESARITYDPTALRPEDLPSFIRSAGYEGSLAKSRDDVEREADAQDERERVALNRDLALAFGLSAPLLVLGMGHGAWAELSWVRWLEFGLASVVVFGPGRRFAVGAWAALRHRTSDMNTLITLGAGSAYGFSALALAWPEALGHHGVPHVYFEASGAIIAFVLLGKKLEHRAKHQLRDAVRGLMARRPESARRIGADGVEEVVALAALALGDRLRVRPGERVAIDGMVLEGRASFDESMLTGESVPVTHGPGERVFSGTLAVEGSLVLEVDRKLSETAMSAIARAVEDAQGSKAPIARLADRVSAVFVPVVLGIAALTAILWAGSGSATALEHFVAVLVIACPCALGLATPAAIAAGTARGAELGVLIKGGDALERASHVQAVLFDKTGTLTRGEMQVVDVLPEHGEEDSLLMLAAAVEEGSEHPVGRAVRAAARGRGLVVPPVTDFQSVVGLGVRGRVDGRLCEVGSKAFMDEAQVDASARVDDAAQLARFGRTPLFVTRDGLLLGLLSVADTLRDESAPALAQLRELGIDTIMVTGDREEAARVVADELGITEAHASMKPEDKVAILRKVAIRRRVAMVGDGINDAPALAAADVGIALGKGTDISISVADIVLVSGSIAALPKALRLARATLHTVRSNLFWAFAYNVVGIPLAAGALSRWGLSLSPVFASAAMSLSSVSVLLNSLRLRRFR